MQEVWEAGKAQGDRLLCGEGRSWVVSTCIPTKHSEMMSYGDIAKYGDALFLEMRPHIGLKSKQDSETIMQYLIFY